VGPRDAVAGGHEDSGHEADDDAGHRTLQGRRRADVGQAEEAGRGQHVAGTAGEQRRDGRLAATRQSTHHNELIVRDIDTDTFQIMDTCIFYLYLCLCHCNYLSFDPKQAAKV